MQDHKKEYLDRKSEHNEKISRERLEDVTIFLFMLNLPDGMSSLNYASFCFPDKNRAQMSPQPSPKT